MRRVVNVLQKGRREPRERNEQINIPIDTLLGTKLFGYALEIGQDIVGPSRGYSSQHLGYSSKVVGSALDSSASSPVFMGGSIYHYSGGLREPSVCPLASSPPGSKDIRKFGSGNVKERTNSHTGFANMGDLKFAMQKYGEEMPNELPFADRGRSIPIHVTQNEALCAQLFGTWWFFRRLFSVDWAMGARGISPGFNAHLHHEKTGA